MGTDKEYLGLFAGLPVYILNNHSSCIEVYSGIICVVSCDAHARADLFSFPVSAFENDSFSIMSPLDLSLVDQDVEVLDEDEDVQDKSCLPQAGPSSSPIQMISPLESLFPPSKLS